MQTFDILIASGPSFNSVCFSSPPLPPFSSLPLWGGITQENRKGGSSPICPPCQVKPEGAGRAYFPAGCLLRAGGGDRAARREQGCLTSVPQGQAWLMLWTRAGVLLEDSIASRESQGLEAGMRPNSGPSCATYLPCGHKQVTGPLWASVSTSVQTEEVLSVLPTSQGCCEELMNCM